MFRAPVDEHRAGECCARVGSYCTWFRKVPCSMYDPEIVCLAWGLSLLCHKNFRARIYSGVFPVHLSQKKTVKLHSSTFIPYSSAVLQSYSAVLQFHSPTLLFYSYTITLCCYTFLQSNPVGIELHSHTLQVNSYVMMRIYIFLQSYTAVT